MMEDHFGLERAPFRLGTDASFYYEAEAHRRAMAHLRYGLRQAEGFVVITGEPGVGKTMVIEQLLLSVQDSDVLAGMLVPNGLTADTLAERVLAAFDRRPIDGVDATESLRDYLADERRRGAKASLIIDEAQHLSDALLEELRLLSDLTEDGDALLQVCLIGQTALRRVLFRDDMEQFRQRIVASYHLAPLSAEDSEAYIRHRMKAAGYEGPDVFTEDAIGAIHRLTGGVPRRINTLCARLLLQAAMDGRDTVDASDAQGTAAEVDVDPSSGPSPDESPDAADDRAATPPETAAPEPRAEPARPALKLVETPVTATDAPPVGETDVAADDEEAEAERALALVTAPPPAAGAKPEGEVQPDDDVLATERPEAGPSFALRAEGGGAQRGYPVSVGEINAAIQSIQSTSTGTVEVPTPKTVAQPQSQATTAPRRRMASPQELMLRGPKPTAPAAVQTTAPRASPETALVAPASEQSRRAPSAAVPGERERALRRFLEETEGALTELRAAMDDLRARVAELDTARRARRERIEHAAQEARDRLDDLRLER